MTDRDKSILEEPEKMCEYCCNFDREHIGMDCTALCKLTMTLAYAEDYGGNCMFYNVPKEQIIVPPCKVGDMVYYIINNTIQELKVSVINIHENNYIVAKAICLDEFDMCDCNCDCTKKTCSVWVDYKSLGKTVFLTKEEAEEKLKELKDNATIRNREKRN